MGPWPVRRYKHKAAVAGRICDKNHTSEITRVRVATLLRRRHGQVDDAAVRNNRLALLKRLADRLGSVAAIEHLSV